MSIIDDPTRSPGCPRRISEGTRTHGVLLFRLQPVRNQSVKSREFHKDVFFPLRPCDCAQMHAVASGAAVPVLASHTSACIFGCCFLSRGQKSSGDPTRLWLQTLPLGRVWVLQSRDQHHDVAETKTRSRLESTETESKKNNNKTSFVLIQVCFCIQLQQLLPETKTNLEYHSVTDRVFEQHVFKPFGRWLKHKSGTNGEKKKKKDPQRSS